MIVILKRIFHCDLQERDGDRAPALFVTRSPEVPAEKVALPVALVSV